MSPLPAKPWLYACGLLICCALCSGAAMPDFELPPIPSAAALREAVPARLAGARAAAARVIPVRSSWLDVAACWRRAPQPEADALGLPLRVCLDRVGVAVPIGYDLPFFDGSALLVEGRPASGSFHVSGGARRTDGWDIVGSILEVRRKGMPCGVVDTAFVTVHASIDLKGNVQERSPRVFGHLMDSHLSCPSRALSPYFEYVREP